MHTNTASSVQPVRLDSFGKHPMLGKVYHSPLTMVGLYIVLSNQAGVVPVMIACALVTLGFYAKRDLGSAVALNLATGLLLLVMNQSGIPAWLIRDNTGQLIFLPALLLLVLSCTTEFLRIKDARFALWLRGATLLALASGLF